MNISKIVLTQFSLNRTIMSGPSHFNLEKDQPLYYFTGRVRTFWNNLVFFDDARNVAVIDIHDVYIYGKQSSSRDLAYLERLIGNSYWKELHSYVSECRCDFPTPWPYQHSRKILWKAKYAWIGFIPSSIKYSHINNIVEQPISYYTGTVLEFYENKIIFGDLRNNVMVTSDNFYVGEERGFIRNIHGSRDPSSVIIHAYIIKLEVLTDVRWGGPEPDLRALPNENFWSDNWVAKFAWYGEMPDIVKDQVGRYYIIRMNQWGDIQSVPSIHEYANRNYKDEQRVPEKRAEPCQSLVPTGQPPGFMKGFLILADNKQGLMTSYVDLIAFTKDNFYVNGEKFMHNYDLSHFFQNRRVPLTAWVVPLDKPKAIFNINVIWHAVCIWYGSPPKVMEYIRKSACGKSVDNLIETTTPVSLTHFLGNIHSLSFASGVLMSKAGLDKDVKISFKKKVVYLFGRRFPSNWNLLDEQHLLEENTWSVLAYPVWSEQVNGIPLYRAIALWHKDDHPSMNILFENISEYVHQTRDDLNKHLYGCIARVTETYGIIQIGSASADATYLYFTKEVLYMNGELFPRNVCLHSVEQGKQCAAKAKTILPKKVDGYLVTMEAILVWIGKKPSFKSSGELTPPDYPRSSPNVQIMESNDDKKPCAAKMETEYHIKPDKVLHAAEGVMVGNIFMVDEHYGLIICSDIIVAFSSDTFYVNKDKFKSKYGSLNEFCSDRKITVRAMIVSLRKPKVLLNCVVMCEAICVWIGQEPSNLTNLQKEHSEKDKTSDTPKISHNSMLYFKGRMTPASKDITLLASTTPEGTSKIFFSKEHLFINGNAVEKDNIFEQSKKSSSQNWSVLAVPMPPKDIMSHSVCYVAVAVWDTSHHHKMRNVLSLIRDQLNIFPDKQEHCINGKFNEISKATSDTTEALLRNLQLEDSSKEESLAQAKVSSQLNGPSVVVSHRTKESSGDKNHTISVDLAHSVSSKQFCGKHITGYIVQKFKDGGVAQWKSQLFEGNVFIEFSTGSLYLNSGPLDEKWKVRNVQSRPCNFYVIPIPHHNVGEHTVSLKATCGWIGKKPPNLPSPGTQHFPRIDLGKVHVTKLVDNQESEASEEELETSEKEESSEECYQNGNVKQLVVSETPVQLFAATNENINGTLIQKTQNGETSRINCITQTQALPQLPSKHQKVDADECGKIWEDKNKKNHCRGTIVEVHSTVGQLKGEDGSLHFFSRESCYLYGVPLHNVELWHVLAQGV